VTNPTIHQVTQADPDIWTPVDGEAVGLVHRDGGAMIELMGSACCYQQTVSCDDVVATVTTDTWPVDDRSAIRAAVDSASNDPRRVVAVDTLEHDEGDGVDLLLVHTDQLDGLTLDEVEAELDSPATYLESETAPPTEGADGDDSFTSQLTIDVVPISGQRRDEPRIIMSPNDD
jgi:hypothetical protein